jgi:hypothetical protein
MNITCMPLKGVMELCWMCTGMYMFTCESKLKIHPILIAVCTCIISLFKLVQLGVKLIIEYTMVFLDYKF